MSIELFEKIKGSLAQLRPEEAKALFEGYESMQDDASDANIKGMPSMLAYSTGFQLGFIAGLNYQKYVSINRKPSNK